MPRATSNSASRGPTPRTYMIGVSRPGTLWMLIHPFTRGCEGTTLESGDRGAGVSYLSSEDPQHAHRQGRRAEHERREVLGSDKSKLGALESGCRQRVRLISNKCGKTKHRSGRDWHRHQHVALGRGHRKPCRPRAKDKKPGGRVALMKENPLLIAHDSRGARFKRMNQLGIGYKR